MTLSSATTALRSISFSGAGFLACYHIGVTACLLQQGYLLRKGELPDEKAPILTGVSAGALTSAGVSAGVAPEDAMNIVTQVVQRTKKAGGRWDALRPGFSLIDQVEDLLEREMKLALGGTVDNLDDYDVDLLQSRIKGGSLLRIGLTNRKVFPPFSNKRAYCYVDGYRSVDDILAACMLSSYVPGLTGPALGSKHALNRTVKRAMTRLKEMERLGCIKNGNGERIHAENYAEEIDDEIDNAREIYWDGGLVDVWPTIDEHTLVVTPISGNFHPNPSICPQTSNDEQEEDKLNVSLASSWFPNTYRVSPRAEIFLCRENMDTMRRMALSSEETVLQDKFAQGYDDAKRFLDRNNMLNVYSAQTESSSTAATGMDVNLS